MPYKNCYACHVGTDAKGLAYFKTQSSAMNFKIGLNPAPSERRPEKFVVLRHVPIDQDTFKYYIDGALTRFDNLSTWKMATPHTIRRKTPQNETCNSCHGNAELFLQKGDVEPKYLKANQKVIVPPDMIPGKN
jgi:thiosulfate/3-mercaptopyruvate sulfurtransferase